MTDFPRIEATEAVILARVSSREQEDGHSIEAQEHRLKSYCERRGLNVLRVFIIIESSTRGDREKFMKVINFCEAHKKPIAIVADKIDRVQRSLKEYPLLDNLVQLGKIELHFNTENCIIHKESRSHERLMWSFGIIMAQSYVDSLRDNVKRSLEHKIRKGEFIGKAPLGYLNIRDGGKGDVIVDPIRAPLIHRLFTEFSRGIYTLREITDLAKTWGLDTRTKKPVSRSQIHLILRNPAYMGVMEVKGKQLPHRYVPIVDSDLFKSCQKVLDKWHKQPFHYAEIDFIFRGILTCKTNGKVVSSYTRKRQYINGGQGSWTYLRSWDEAGKSLLIREEKIIAQVEKAIQGLVFPVGVKESIIEFIRDADLQERDYVRRKIEELRKEDARIQSRLSGIMELLMDGAISRAEYDARRLNYHLRQKEIASDIASNQDADGGFKDALIALLNLCNKAPDMFRKGENAIKRMLLNFVFSNLSLEGETLCFDYRFPLCDYAQMAKSPEWLALLEALLTFTERKTEILLLVSRYQNLFACTEQIE